MRFELIKGFLFKHFNKLSLAPALEGGSHVSGVKRSLPPDPHQDEDFHSKISGPILILLAF